MNFEVNPRLTHTVLLLLVVSGVCALGILLWATPFGIGVSPDSTVYIATARSIGAGDGFQSGGKPITHYPPIYPTVLALSGLLGTGPLDGARWLHAFLFALNVVLIGISTYLYTGSSFPASLCSILLFLSSAHMLDIHTMAWSEPLFISFSLSAFLLLTFYIAKPRIWLLVASSSFLGLAITTRYAGVTLLPVMILGILLFEEKPARTRIRSSFILLAIGISPLAIWLFRNISVAHSAINRTLAFHPINISHIKEFVHTMYDFWLPFSCPTNLQIPQLLLAGGLVFTAFLLVLRHQIRDKAKVGMSTVMQTLIFLFSITYVSFLFASISFADAHTCLSYRIMSPVYVFGIIFIVSVSRSVSNLKRGPSLWWCLLSVLFVVTYINLDRAASFAIHLHNEGSGYTKRIWRNSESIAYVKSLPDGAMIYSNGPDIIHFLTGIKAKDIPAKVNTRTRASNPYLARELRAMRNNLIEKRALIVYLDNITWRWYLPTKKELEDVYKIPVLFRLQDGTVYAIREQEMTLEQGASPKGDSAVLHPRR
jgi:hypothetical protein